MEHAQNLREIDLSGNKLTELPVNFSQITNLVTLNLSRNPFKVESHSIFARIIEGNPFLETFLLASTNLKQAGMLDIFRAYQQRVVGGNFVLKELV